MRNRVFGIIGIVWGGAIVAWAIYKGGPSGRGAFAAGEIAGMVMGGLMLIAGISALLKGNRSN
jgi:hypothetical protein